MQTIEVTDEQHAFVQRLRQEISEQVVGKYGYVRERDAIQFLIDNLDGDLELDEEFDVQDVETDAPTPAEVDDSEDGAAVTFDESDSELEPEPDDAGPDESDSDDADGDEASEDDDSEADEPTDDGSAVPGDDAETVDEDEASGGDETSEDDEQSDGDASETDGDGAADDDDMLNEMMSLLDTHEDKWDESSSADYRYSVELPDGTSEDVQTKDDVRALLFKHYR